MERLILDTGALIALEHGEIDSDQLGGDDADVAISAITAAELLVGVELADDQRREPRSTLVEGVFTRVEIVVYDLQIAATARATGRTIVTTYADAFDGLPGVSYRLIPTG